MMYNPASSAKINAMPSKSIAAPGIPFILAIMPSNSKSVARPNILGLAIENMVLNIAAAKTRINVKVNGLR
ncbi:hypothetical protein D3C78_1863640 [compost metagenome]